VPSVDGAGRTMGERAHWTLPEARRASFTAFLVRDMPYLSVVDSLCGLYNSMGVPSRLMAMVMRWL
jgi:hypothetical protein